MYQTDEHKANLDDIGVGHRVQPSHQSVDNGHSSRGHNRDVRRDIHHHANCQSYTQKITLVPLLASPYCCTESNAVQYVLKVHFAKTNKVIHKKKHLDIYEDRKIMNFGNRDKGNLPFGLSLQTNK